jgi:hypothetical protein
MPFGVSTPAEIECERTALKLLRGGYDTRSGRDRSAKQRGREALAAAE